MNNFMRDNKFWVGVNYWCSRNSINMWEDWSAEAVEEDFKRLSSHGVRALRMFLVWPVFQPLKAIWANMKIYEYRMGEEPLPDTEAGRAGVSEEACGHFAEFCALADKYNLKLIVGLLTGHMSFRFYWPDAFQGRNFLSDPTLIKWEVRFVRYFVKRFRDQPSIIAWDLGNECNCLAGGIPQDQGFVWSTCISAAIRESDPTRPVVSGFAGVPLDLDEQFNCREHAETVDVLTTHPYQIFSYTQIDPVNSMRGEIDPAVRASLFEDIGGKPAFVEEVGSIGYTNNSEKSEAEFLRTGLWSTWAQGNRGFFWWCSSDQGHLDYAPYDWNNYGSDYGFFRKDGSPKPLAHTAKEFTDFIENYEYGELPPHTTEAICIITRELKNNFSKIAATSFILAKQANIDVRFAHADEKLPDSQLYIMPSVVTSKPIFLHRLNELLEKVREGAALYFSLGSTLFRRLPELTGLTVESREAGGPEEITLGSDKFTLGGGMRYNIEAIADTCEVLAAAPDGRPVFVRNRYGKGSIYFLTFPMELQLADKAGIFRDADKPPYYRFYEVFAKAVDDRAARSSHPCVLTTEHPLSDGKRIITAVNYSGETIDAPLALREGWAPCDIARGGYAGGNMKITPHDALVMTVTK
ncbi:MAG: hypothetical protein GX628_06705 [Clostridiales bacterium]|nr:hypothetical protein [Clostridiales bacterium]